MGCAPMSYVLYNEVMKHNPKNPDWASRDRFVLSAGHGSMLQYSLMHLAGYDSVKVCILIFSDTSKICPLAPNRLYFRRPLRVALRIAASARRLCPDECICPIDV